MKIQAAKALIRNGEGKILVLYRSETHPRLAHDIDLPGGEIDHGESLEGGLMREIVEETGMDVVVKDKNLRHQWKSLFGQKQYLFEVEVDELKVNISWEHESYEWLTDEEFAKFPAIDSFMHEAQRWVQTRA